jgi:hypothetical protein
MKVPEDNIFFMKEFRSSNQWSWSDNSSYQAGGKALFALISISLSSALMLRWSFITVGKLAYQIESVKSA